MLYFPGETLRICEALFAARVASLIKEAAPCDTNGRRLAI